MPELPEYWEATLFDPFKAVYRFSTKQHLLRSIERTWGSEWEHMALDNINGIVQLIDRRKGRTILAARCVESVTVLARSTLFVKD
jgi:hypothetical protein